MTPPLADISWAPAWRIIPSRFPPIQLFERVSEPADWDAVMELESLTNPRLRDEVGDIQLVSPADRISGPGAGAIMAAFTHLNPAGSRFSDGAYGVFYTAREIETAIAETKHHRAAFMRATMQAAQELDMRVYAVDLNAQLHDLRGQQSALPEIYDLKDYSAGQTLGRRLRSEGSHGIAYDSVRRAGGSCAAVFKPPVLSNCRQERHLCYVWDGKDIGLAYEKRELG